MNSSDKLVVILPSQWTELRDLFLKNWPENHIAWHTINSYVSWFKLKPDIKNLKMYSLNGTWRSDGTYLVAVSFKLLCLLMIFLNSFSQDRYQILIYSLENQKEKLKAALRLADWSVGVKVTFNARFRSAVVEVAQEKNLKVEYDHHLFDYFLPKEEAKKFVLK